jgi:glutamine synthetase
MLGSQANVSDPNIVLNTIVADAFEGFADELEKAKDVEKEANKIITRELKAHYRIIFNLDGYGPDWEPEAMKRGLLNNKNTADATRVMFEEKNIEVFVKQGVFTREEAVARGEIQLENYTKTINIEALTMLEMAKQDIIPAISNYVADLCANVAAKQAVSEKLACTTEKTLIEKLSALNDDLFAAVGKLEKDLKAINKDDVEPASQAMAHVIVPDMEAVRKIADTAETLTAEEYWPYSSYFDLLYSVK